MDMETRASSNESRKGKRMRACLCWNCGQICVCDKVFPSGRPKRRSDCPEFAEAPPDPPRITQKEMADILGCSERKIAKLITAQNGVRRLTKALAIKGIMVTYERSKKRIYFYREEN